MKKLESVLKAVGDRNRLRILKLLEDRKMCVCELAFVLGIKQPSVSRHLKKLKASGLIDSEQDGVWTNYMLGGENLFAREILRNLRFWLKDDVCILEDQRKAGLADRQTLYCNGK